MVGARYLPQRVPLVDQNGIITREWFLFLQQFFPTEGGGASDDLSLAPVAGDSPALRDEVSELRKRVDDMRKGTPVL